MIILFIFYVPILTCKELNSFIVGIESVAPGFCTAIQPLKTPYIINFLNSNSSEIPNDNRFGRYYTTPAEFDLFYMFRGDENSWINKIHTCILLNMEVNYAPNGYQTFRPIQGRNGAPPSEIDMKLDFQETKLITKEDVELGF